MSLESRSSSALFKRAEQLKRWEQSETNREPAQPRQVARKIKFSADCVFLAACAAGDKEEVVRLLQKGADINTGNVDGLTALHQVQFICYPSFLLFVYIARFPSIHRIDNNKSDRVFPVSCFLPILFPPRGNNSYRKMATISLQLSNLSANGQVLFHVCYVIFNYRKKYGIWFRNGAYAFGTMYSLFDYYTTTPSDNTKQNCPSPLHLRLLFIHAGNVDRKN